METSLEQEIAGKEAVERSQEDNVLKTEGPSPKKKRRKGVIAGAVVLAVVLIAGIGMWIWHEQPSFCGTVCHDTMGSYLEGYESGDFLAHNHAQAGVACLNCHEAELNTQVAELQVQMSGDYRLPLAKMETTDEFCLRDGCHIRALYLYSDSSAGCHGYGI